MPSYLLQGFHREDHSMEVFMLVNKPEGEVEGAFEIAELVAPWFRFNAGEQLDVLVSDDCTLTVFTDRQELLDAAPLLQSHWLFQRRNRRSRKPR